ncbi:MAG: hypothetical protein Q9186_007669, partial [Xanthomendoza sp. 1 TL-2023]
TATSTFTYSVTELTLGILTANLPVLSIVATKTFEILSGYSGIFSSSRGSSSGGKSRFYKKKIPSDGGVGDESGFGEGTKEGGRPTRRCDVEYGSREGLYVK